MIESAPERRCADCGGILIDVKLFGRTMPNPISGAAADSDLMYSVGTNPERSSFLGMFKMAGSVQTSMCDECHRIYLYGHPHN